MQKCFKILMLSLICLSVICSTFAFTVSAAEYDLRTPVLWRSPYPNTSDNPYPTFLPQNAGSSKFFLLYYDKYKTSAGWQDHFLWSVKSNSTLDIKSVYDSITYRARDSALDYNSPALAFGISADNTRSLNNTLCIPGLEYKDVYWPTDNQVIKIEFSLDTFVLGTSQGIPDTFYSFLQPQDLCFFTCTAGENGTGNMTLLSKAVHFDSVVVSPSLDSRKIKFTYYFNGYGDAFTDLKSYVDNHYPGSTLSLVVRFPYYLGSSSLISDGAYIVSNANLPVSYELMTPGDYSQDLNNIQNAITESNEKLMDYYNTISGEDQIVIVHAQQQNDKLDSAMDDFNKSDEAIKDIANSAVAPDVQGSASDAISNIDSSGIKKVFANPYIISLFTLVLGFGFLRLILYGTKEG